MTRIGIIIGSTRPGRKGEAVAQWVHEIAERRTDADYELVDIADYALPHFDELLPPAADQYQKPHTFTWAEKIASLDGFVIVTPEYNHSVPGALKNALDFLYKEWTNKAVGFVSYGAAGGTRAVEHLRAIVANLEMADVRAQVSLGLFTDFENMATLKPLPMQEPALELLLTQVVAWTNALDVVRNPVVLGEELVAV